MAGVDPESPESRRVNNVERSFESLKLYFLSIEIKSASNLVAADHSLKGSSSDPFVQVYANNQSYTTKTIMKNLDPIFNESTTFCFFDIINEIEFKVFDWDKNTKHDEIGSCKLNTSSFFQNNNPGFIGNLKLENVKKGELNVSVHGRLIIPKELEDRVSSLEMIKNDQSNKISINKNELNTLTNTLNETKSLNNNYKSENEGLNVNLNTLQMQETSIKDESDKIRIKIKKAKKDVESFQQQAEECRSKAQKLEMERDGHTTEMNRQKSRRDTKIERMEQMRKEILET